jgi:hypothetical protein
VPSNKLNLAAITAADDWLYYLSSWNHNLSHPKLGDNVAFQRKSSKIGVDHVAL